MNPGIFRRGCFVMNALSIKNLYKTYHDGTQALKDVSLEIESGDFFGLMGANGAGKTTLIGIVTGLINRTAGEASVLGHDIATDFPAAKRLIGVVPQEFNFNIFEKVEDILVTQAGYFGIDKPQAEEAAEHLLKKLGLWSKRGVPSRALSGGMKRRLMIARALMHNPRLLILDEPTAGVDVELRYEMWEYLKEINRAGLTILLTTHYLEEVERMCRHAAIIKNGEIIKRDLVRNLVELMEKDTYVVIVKQIGDLDEIKEYKPFVIDENIMEVELNRKSDLHDFILRLTEAGMGIKGTVASATSLGILLHQGIGDTIRVSLTPQPGGARSDEVLVAQEILQSLNLRAFTPSVTACPGCGRTTSDYFQTLADDIQIFLRESMPQWKEIYPGVENLSVAVMGCVVNGPGESKHANIGISLPGSGEAPVAPVYIDGEKSCTLRGDHIADEFKHIVTRYIHEHYV